MTFRILTDSASDLDNQWLKDNNVDVLGLTVQVDGVTYETVGDQALTSPVLLAKMAAGSQPSTSQVNVGQFEEFFRQVVSQGESVIYIALSSVLSGTYQSAFMAREMVLEDYPEAEIVLIDTLGASAGQGYLVREAAASRQAGASLAAVAAEIADMASRLKTHFLVDDLNHLMRGGRISKAAALIGGLVNIKPIIAIGSDGKLGTAAKVRGKKKALAEFLRLGLDDLAGSTVVLGYTDDLAQAEDVKNLLIQEHGLQNVIINPIGPVIGAHVGPGTLAIFSVANTAR